MLELQALFRARMHKSHGPTGAIQSTAQHEGCSQGIMCMPGLFTWSAALHCVPCCAVLCYAVP